MTGSLQYGDDKVLRVSEQVSQNRQKKMTFHVSEILTYEYQRPGFFRVGYLRFHLKSGAQTPDLMVPSNARKVFDELIQTIDRDLNQSTQAAERQSQTSSATSRRRPRLETPASSPSEARGSTISDFETWVAVDIEWTDSTDPTSICEIGLAKFKDGRLIDSWQSYIKPPGRFAVGEGELRANGIQPHLLTGAPMLGEAWETIADFARGSGWVLHNATQDVNRVLASLEATRASSDVNFDYIDTLGLTKKLPLITSRSGLQELAEFFDIEREFARYDGRDAVENPHGALEDATLTGQVLVRTMGLVSFTSVKAFLKLMDAQPGSVRKGQVTGGFSSAGKFKYPDVQSLPSEAELLNKVDRAEVNLARQQARRSSAELARDEFLQHPEWSDLKVTKGTRVCFTQLMPWDDEREFGFQEDVERVAKRLGLIEQGINKKLDLLIVNDPWVRKSAKLRDCLAKGIPVTTYSIFQQNNPEFPVWNYRKAEQYRWLKAEGLWPEE